MRQPDQFSTIFRPMASRPWAIRPDAYRSLMGQVVCAKADKLDDLLGLEPAKPALDLRDGVAVVPIFGVLGRRLPEWAKMYFGMEDVDTVMSLLSMSEQSDEAQAVVLHVDSPGGGVDGIEECAALIASMGKPVVAYCDMACSGGYWLASQADEVLVMPSSVTANVGVYQAVATDAQAWANDGWKMNLFKSIESPVKAIGVPGLDISEAQAKHLQAQVDYLYGRFAGSVKAARPGISPEAMDGRDFLGAQAIEMGVADSLGDLDQAIADAQALADLRT